MTVNKDNTFPYYGGFQKYVVKQHNFMDAMQRCWRRVYYLQVLNIILFFFSDFINRLFNCVSVWNNFWEKSFNL